MKNKLIYFKPSMKQIILVYSIRVFLTYSWVIMLFFYDLPRLNLFLAPFELFAVFSYSIVFAFIDSILFSGILLILSIFIYRKYLIEKYVPVMGSIAIISYLWIGALRIMYQPKLLNNLVWIDDPFLIWIIISLASTISIGFVAYRSTQLQNILHLFADKVQVFLYIYLPLSIICIFIVGLRNLI